MTTLRLVEERPLAGRVVALEAGQVIGREGCDIVLADPEVSRRHAAVRAVESTLALEDLGSLNGTFVNGGRVNGTTVLAVGDTVQLGNTVMRVEA